MSVLPETATSPLNDVNTQIEVPKSPTKTPATDNAATRRHTKGLSLNFPVLLPANGQISHLRSPSTSSGIQSPIESALSSPHPRTAPFKSPDLMHEKQEKTNTNGSADFLTLLAAQERRVLELKEELQKAEADLLQLKKQWASYEANKKRDEVKHIKKLQPLALDDVAGRHPIAEEEVDEERRRKRALLERSNTIHTSLGNSRTNNLGRKNSKRVFEGSRHARTLSLLSPTTGKPGHAATTNPTDDVTTLPNAREAESDTVVTKSPLPQMSNLDGLMSADYQLGFGQTYKHLAAHRRSLPPAAADLLVKQGKQVYDGFREGLWTFFEDIRQATVGEEGISGTAAQQRPVRPRERKVTHKSEPGSAKNSNQSLSNNSQQSSKEPSFWKEFGLDTPQRPGSTQLTKTDQSNGHSQQKSSTDSTNPPSLLPDLNDNDDVEDGWDAWDSSVSIKSPHVVDETKKTSGDGLPWPEIQKLTPSKLTRTVSDLMREWDAGQEEGKAPAGAQTDLLDNPHM
ncbi:uncharacterized protein Z518_00428 [Rhinocladiella mackenziei CBS 650.93]|uniref:DUF4048 domain-containing protein n=1 Tax=Rhinocladiella mackenziei CBS 650.93 TaxID=1442369 RepID=A0A0D2ITF4_9EURO|nr:uncharacterized protein Z518_00428 [Rhinocladiella mackenziei CBS 650.93]KIX09349.1 hypothetical protein Z518_00428 [Rhinocladiella mackenziei CBS 650.93]